MFSEKLIEFNVFYIFRWLSLLKTWEMPETYSEEIPLLYSFIIGLIHNISAQALISLGKLLPEKGS